MASLRLFSQSRVAFGDLADDHLDPNLVARFQESPTTQIIEDIQAFLKHIAGRAHVLSGLARRRFR